MHSVDMDDLLTIYRAGVCWGFGEQSRAGPRRSWGWRAGHPCVAAAPSWGCQVGQDAGAPCENSIPRLRVINKWMAFNTAKWFLKKIVSSYWITSKNECLITHILTRTKFHYYWNKTKLDSRVSLQLSLIIVSFGVLFYSSEVEHFPMSLLSCFLLWKDFIHLES